MVAESLCLQRMTTFWRSRSGIFSLIVLLALAFVSVVASPDARAESTIRSILADGFDYPVGKPNASGYYIYRGFRPNGHLGEDWNGNGGGNSDLGDPVYAIGHGVVVYSKDYKMGWGNVVIIRHAYRNTDGRVYYVDSLYAHLHERMVSLHETVTRGQKIGTIGTNRGMYLAHLHFEIRKNLNVGMSRSKYPRDFSIYYSPRSFIDERRSLRKEYRLHNIPVDNFGTGASNYRKGPALKSFPVIPDGKEMPAPILPEDIRTVLAKNDLLKEVSFARVEDDTPRTSLKERTIPAIGEERAQEERDKIRSFWGKYREELREPSPADASPIVPDFTDE